MKWELCSMSLFRRAAYAAALCTFALMHGTACAQQKEFEGTKIVVNGFGGNLDDVLVESMAVTAEGTPADLEGVEALGAYRP